jgi:hypothetical protein
VISQTGVLSSVTINLRQNDYKIARSRTARVAQHATGEGASR